MINVATFNCNSIRNNNETVKSLLAYNDIVVLQELMLCECDVDYLSLLSPNHDWCCGVKDKVIDGITTGRPSKGVAIMWKKCYSSYIKPLSIDNTINAIIIESTIGNILLINVYMPYENNTDDSLDKFRCSLSIVESIMLEHDICNVLLIGDFNADPKKGKFWLELQESIIYKYDFVPDINFMPVDSFTYLSAAHNTTSWLDHVFINRGLANRMTDLRINYDLALFDHFPLEFSLLLNIKRSNNIVSNFDILKFVDWNRVNEQDVSLYKSNLDYLINEFVNMNEFRCTGCNDKECKIKLDKFYEYLTKILLVSSDDISIQKKSRFKCVPGWNDHVKKSYVVAREKFIIWKNKGKPLSGPEIDDMKTSRSYFKTNLRNCKINEDKIRKNKLAENMKSNNSKQFWKEVNNIKSVNNCKSKVSNIIDDEADSNVIVDKFSNFYKSTLNHSFNFDNASLFDNLFMNFENNGLSEYRINLSDIKRNILKLKPYLGHDNVHSGHIKNCSFMFLKTVALFFNSCLQHSHIPDLMSKGIIKPLIKDKYNNLDNITNYRPIMSSTVMLKVFENILLDKFGSFFVSDDRQHGFKAKYSTATASFILKETIGHYLNDGSDVYAAFIDLTKAFDRVDHFILCKKLMNYGFPCIFVKLIASWYSNQNVQVCYDNKLSSEWLLKSGVRQGGILSPLLFSIYIDDIIKNLSSSRIGCMLGIHWSNVIAYADDLVLLSPSLLGLKELLNSLIIDTKNINLAINFSKSVCIKFCNSKKPVILNDVHVLSHKIKFVERTKYLGYFYDFNLNNEFDILSNLRQFYKQFNVILRKFKNVEIDVLLKLFKTYCLQIYGSSMWFLGKYCKSAMKQFAVAYHKSIKKILNVPYGASNHDCCEILNLLTFNHFINFNKIRFVYKLFMNPCNFVLKNLSFLKKDSLFLKEINDTLAEQYDVYSDLFLNDLDGILSRIFFKQSREDRSTYICVYDFF